MNTLCIREVSLKYTDDSCLSESLNPISVVISNVSNYLIAL